MRRTPILPLALSLCLALLPTPASPAPASEGSITGLVVEERDDEQGRRTLWITVPARLDGRGVDAFRIDLPTRLARAAEPRTMPAGWGLRLGRGGRLEIFGPTLETRMHLVAFALGLPVGVPLPNECAFEILSRGARLADGRIDIRKLPPLLQLGALDQLLRLPSLIVPGRSILFRPLDPSRTPAGGTWKLDGEPATWNGSLDHPDFTWTPKELDPSGDIEVEYIDPWGFSRVKAIADCAVGTPAAGGGDRPAIAGGSPRLLAGDTGTVCGHFPSAASLDGLRFNGEPLADHVVAASPGSVEYRVPAGAEPGDYTITGDAAAGYGEEDRAGGVVLEIEGEIDRERLWKGEATPMRLSVRGTDLPVTLELWNATPGVVTLEGGESQQATSTGGADNKIEKTVHAVQKGEFELGWKLEVDYQCGEYGAELAGLAWADPAATTEGTSTRPRDPCPEAEDCEELRRAAEAAEGEARRARWAAERARENREWHEREARALDDELAADREHLATLRRQAAEWRQLAADAKASAKLNRERDERQPNQGWDRSAAFDDAEEKRRLAAAKRLEQELAALEAEIADKTAMAAALRGLEQSTEAEASAAERAAREARAAYEACLARRAAECPPALADGGSATAIDDDSGDDPRDVGEPAVSYCGPDVTVAYLGALQRVYRRMQAIGDGEKGVYDGTRFLGRNGWNIDQWPSNTGADGKLSICPSGTCAPSGNSVGQYCYTLFGRCVPGHVLNDIMFGFTADLVYVPTAMQEIGAHWAEGKYNSRTEAEKAKYTDGVGGYLYGWWTAPDPAISARSYAIGDELAEEWSSGTPMGGSEVAAEIAGDWEGFLSELTTTYPWLADCVPCPASAPFDAWSRDWSRAPWRLVNGDLVDEDGNLVPEE